jgi:Glycosyl hydrolase-like 10
MKRLVTIIFLFSGLIVLGEQQHWSADTFVIWTKKKDAPQQTSVVSFSDWLVFGDATFGKPGVRFIINKMAAAGIRNIWWRTFGGGHAQYTSKVNEVTMANYAGQGADYAKYNSLKDAVEYAHKLGIKIKAWYTPLEEAHGWADNVRSRYTDLHKDMWDRNLAGLPTGAPSFYYKKYRDYKLDLAREMLCDYDIDGIVIDFERGGAPSRNDVWGYLPAMVKDFNRKYNRSGTPKSDDPKWQAYRAENLGKFMRGIKKIVKEERKRPADITAIFPARKELSAHYDIPRWSKEKIIDGIGLIAHGKSWGYPSPILAGLKRKYNKYSLPTSVILYSLQGSKEGVQKCFDKAVAGGARDIIWFETTYLYFKKRYSIPLAAACPRKVVVVSPEYDFSRGGKIVITAAGTWSLKLDNKLIGKGEADKVYRIDIPHIKGRKRLTVECVLPVNSSKAGIAIQGKIGTKQVHTNARWTSRQGKVLTLAQPGIPPFLAPLDIAISGGVK